MFLSVLKKPFISLARMILWSERYEQADVNPENPEETCTTEAAADLHAARALARTVLETNRIETRSIRVDDLNRGDWLAATDLEWADPGQEMIAIPDLRKKFLCFNDLDT